MSRWASPTSNCAASPTDGAGPECSTTGFRVRDGLATADNTDTSFPLGRREPIPFLWIGTDQPTFWTGNHMVSVSPIHIAFKAKDRAGVDAFYKATLANGGTDNGPPGPRGPAEMKYYGAYVLDPTATTSRRVFGGSEVVLAPPPPLAGCRRPP